MDVSLEGFLGSEETDQYIRSLHCEKFRQWLMYPVANKKRDLDVYLKSLSTPKLDVLRRWRQFSTHYTYAPELFDSPEIKLFQSDLDAVIQVVWNEAAATETLFKTHDRADEDWRVQRLVRWIEESHGAPALTLCWAAKKLRVSAQHLGRLFHRQVGRTFKAQLRAVRLREALDLLAHPELSVKEVSAALGYHHETHFTSEFRTQFGTSPGKWRGRMRQDPTATLK